MLAGGTTEEKAANADIQDKVNQVKAKFLENMGENAGDISDFTAVSYKSQVVAGTNYFVKVRTGEDTYAHLRIFMPLPFAGDTPELVGNQTSKTKEDPISYF